MQELALRGSLVALAALNDQQVLLGGDVDIGGLEAGNGQRDAIGILAAALDVEGGIIVAALRAGGVFQQVEQAVEANGVTAIGGEVETVLCPKSSINEQFPDCRGPVRAPLAGVTPEGRRMTRPLRYASRTPFQEGRPGICQWPQESRI